MIYWLHFSTIELKWCLSQTLFRGLQRCLSGQGLATQAWRPKFKLPVPTQVHGRLPSPPRIPELSKQRRGISRRSRLARLADRRERASIYAKVEATTDLYTYTGMYIYTWTRRHTHKFENEYTQKFPTSVWAYFWTFFST